MAKAQDTSNRTALELVDSLNEKTAVLTALLDAVRVAQGSGDTKGLEMNDDTIPDAMWHAMNLIQESRAEIKELFEHTRRDH